MCVGGGCWGWGVGRAAGRFPLVVIHPLFPKGKVSVITCVFHFRLEQGVRRGSGRIGICPRGTSARRDANKHDTVSEWLRRWTRNPLGSARRSSNPLGVVALNQCVCMWWWCGLEQSQSAQSQPKSMPDVLLTMRTKCRDWKHSPQENLASPTPVVWWPRRQPHAEGRQFDPGQVYAHGMSI